MEFSLLGGGAHWALELNYVPPQDIYQVLGTANHNLPNHHHQERTNPSQTTNHHDI